MRSFASDLNVRLAFERLLMHYRVDSQIDTPLNLGTATHPLEIVTTSLHFKVSTTEIQLLSLQPSEVEIEHSKYH
jgi:hypothetical protein